MFEILTSLSVQFAQQSRCKHGAQDLNVLHRTYFISKTGWVIDAGESFGLKLLF
jgi:hypothetical protein